LATGYFPSTFQGLSSGTYWILGVIAAVMLFASVLLHELGHALVAQHHNVSVKSITLFMFGGVSELPDEPASPGIEAKVTLGGWLVSAVVAGIFYGIYKIIPGSSNASVIGLALSRYLAVVNGLVFVFNGLPGFPLDGGRLLRALLFLCLLQYCQHFA
jgi:Zn-dependent protease